jgi:hypothetical protein
MTSPSIGAKLKGLASEGREVFPSVEQHFQHFPWATMLYACVIALVICYVLLNR